MQGRERLSRLQGLEPLSWLARSYAVNGPTLVKLRVTQLLQLILGDAISDSAASSADLPPNQVVTFASSNLTLSLGFTGVDWSDGIPADAAADLPHKGLTAVKRALEQLTDSFDPDHMSVSFEAFPKPRGPPRAPSPGAKQVAGAAVTAGAAPGVPPAAANMARRLLLTPQHLHSASRSAGGSIRQRQLSAVGSTPELTVVYVRLHGMDPMNMTSLMERLSNCSAQTLQEAGPQDGPAQQHSGRMPGMTPGVPLKPSCTEAFRQQLQQAGVTVSPGPAFTIAPLEQPQATIGLSVAIGITREQQQASTDMKASAWLNSSAMQDIMGTFNLTVTSSDQDYVSYLRDKDTGRFPPLSGLNLNSLLPQLFQTVIAASRNMTQQDRERQQQQQQPQLVTTSASPALLNRGILAGIVVAVVASVGALVGVVVLLLRRRTERSSQQGAGGDAGATTGSDRRRRRRPRMYHTKYLSDAAPVLGHTEEQGGTSGIAAAASTPAQAAAGAGPVSRHTLERGDSVMSQVNLELDEAQEDEDAGSESAASTAALTPTQPQRQQHQQRQLLQQQQQQRLGTRLERQQGDAGSGGSSSRQQLLGGMLHTSSNASSSVIVIPADAAAWDDGGSVTAPTVSVDVGASSRSLSPWGSQGDTQAVAAVAAGEAKQGGRAASRHRLSLVSQADQAPALTGAAAVQDGAGVSTGQQQQGSVQQGQHARLHVAAAGGGGGSFSPASAFAAMDAQLAAAEAAAMARSGGGSKGCSSGGGSTTPSVGAVQPLSESCWHKGGHVSGFLVPEAVAVAAVQGTSSSSSSAGTTQQHVVPPPQRRPGALVSPFAAAIQLANSVASDEV